MHITSRNRTWTWKTWRQKT